jgi:hypothetical protein
MKSELVDVVELLASNYSGYGCQDHFLEGKEV